MATNDRESGAEQRPNDTPELADELRSIRAIGESADTIDDAPATDSEKVDPA